MVATTEEQLWEHALIAARSRFAVRAHFPEGEYLPPIVVWIKDGQPLATATWPFGNFDKKNMDGAAQFGQSVACDAVLACGFEDRSLLGLIALGACSSGTIRAVVVPPGRIIGQPMRVTMDGDEFDTAKCTLLLRSSLENADGDPSPARCRAAVHYLETQCDAHVTLWDEELVGDEPPLTEFELYVLPESRESTEVASYTAKTAAFFLEDAALSAIGYLHASTPEEAIAEAERRCKEVHRKPAAWLAVKSDTDVWQRDKEHPGTLHLDGLELRCEQESAEPQRYVLVAAKMPEERHWLGSCLAKSPKEALAEAQSRRARRFPEEPLGAVEVATESGVWRRDDGSLSVFSWEGMPGSIPFVFGAFVKQADKEWELSALGA